MKFSPKPLNEQVIVITGATSGIGLATALAAAAKGAKVVLAARTEQALKDAQQQIKEQTPSAEILTVTTDVSDKAQLENLCQLTVKKFGRIDTWVNNAGVSLYGKLQEVANDDFQKLIDTNFWGLVNGSLIAVKQMKETGGGTIINLGSELSDHAITLQGMYAASKHAVKGFTDSLRMEMDDEGAPIAVTLIKPSAIATPFPDHAKNYMDQEAKLPKPIYAPEEVAYAILHAAVTPTRDIFVGASGRVSSLLNKLAPRAFDWLAELMGRSQIGSEPALRPQNNLYEGYSQANTRGRNPGFVMEKSLYTRSALHPIATGLILAGAAIGAVALLTGTTLVRQTPTQRYRAKLKALKKKLPQLESKVIQFRRAFH